MSQAAPTFRGGPSLAFLRSRARRAKPASRRRFAGVSVDEDQRLAQQPSVAGACRRRAGGGVRARGSSSTVLILRAASLASYATRSAASRSLGAALDLRLGRDNAFEPIFATCQFRRGVQAIRQVAGIRGFGLRARCLASTHSSTHGSNRYGAARSTSINYCAITSPRQFPRRLSSRSRADNLTGG